MLPAIDTPEPGRAAAEATPALTFTLPTSWRVFSPEDSTAAAVTAAAEGVIDESVAQLAETVAALMRDGKVRYCAFGPVPTPSGETQRGSVTVRLTPDPGPRIVSQAAQALHARHDAADVTVTSLDNDGGSYGCRVAWRGHFPAPAGVNAEYFLPFPGGTLAVIGASVPHAADTDVLAFFDDVAATARLREYGGVDQRHESDVSAACFGALGGVRKQGETHG